MEKIKNSKAWKISKKIFLVILSIYMVIVFIRLFQVFDERKTNAQVQKIHSTKLTMDDVMGKNLPTDPGAEADKTVAGFDTNMNGIRDDVELAVFKEYPNSAKTRAVLLQLALVFQMESTLPILNTKTATAIVEDNESRAYVCVWSISSRNDMKKFDAETGKHEMFIKNLQFNTPERKEVEGNFYKYVRSYASSNDGCDIDISKLNN